MHPVYQLYFAIGIYHALARIGVTNVQNKICDIITWSEPPFRALSNDVGVWGAYPSRNGRKTGVTASKLPEPTQTPPIGAMQMQQIMHQTRMHAHAAEIQSPAMRGQPAAIRHACTCVGHYKFIPCLGRLSIVPQIS